MKKTIILSVMLAMSLLNAQQPATTATTAPVSTEMNHDSAEHAEHKAAEHKKTKTKK